MKIKELGSKIVKVTKKAIIELKRKINVRRLYVTYKDFSEKWGVKFSTHDGKMSDFHSISTSCKSNPNCKRYQSLDGSICKDCFSEALQNIRKNLKAVLEKNFDVLTTVLIPEEEWPLLNDLLFRIESFGDLATVIQARNYLRLIKRNPLVRFGWWTKNPHIILKALELEGYDTSKHERPSNVTFLVSSVYKNKALGVDVWQKAYYFIDKEFTVYTAEYMLENGLDETFINCGSRRCLDCKNCYLNTGDRQVRELLK